MKAASSTTAGFVLGMAQTSVIPPASAAAVPVLKSSLCTAPGSLAQVDIGRKPEVQGPYTQTIDLWFEPFFEKEIRRVIEWMQDIKTADQHYIYSKTAKYIF